MSTLLQIWYELNPLAYLFGGLFGVDIKKLTSDFPCFEVDSDFFIAIGDPLALCDSGPRYCIGAEGGAGSECAPNCCGGGKICCTGVSFLCGVWIGALRGGNANAWGGPGPCTYWTGYAKAGGGGGGPCCGWGCCGCGGIGPCCWSWAACCWGVGYWKYNGLDSRLG